MKQRKKVLKRGNRRRKGEGRRFFNHRNVTCGFFCYKGKQMLENSI